MWMGRILGKFLFCWGKKEDLSFFWIKGIVVFFVHISKLIYTCIDLSFSLVVITCQTDRGIGIALI